MSIKSKRIIKNAIDRKKCTQQSNNITKICIDQTTFLSLNNINGIPSTYTDMIEYTVKGNVNKIYLLSHNDESFLDTADIEFLVKIIDITIDTIYKMFSIQNKKTFNLIILGSTERKQFPCDRYNKITEDHVNSADTTFYDTGSILIRIYRQEELIKVLIHETIHFTQIEKQVLNVNKKFNINRELHLNEAIVETLATYINCQIYSEINKVSINELIYNEIRFGILQSAKILYHFGFSSISDFLTNKSKKIVQTTSVFEYHILKTILLINFEKFIKIIRSNESLITLLMDTFNDYNYQKRVDKYIKKVKNMPHNIKCTFRMTITDTSFKKNDN